MILRVRYSFQSQFLFWEKETQNLFIITQLMKDKIGFELKHFEHSIFTLGTYVIFVFLSLTLQWTCYTLGNKQTYTERLLSCWWWIGVIMNYPRTVDGGRQVLPCLIKPVIKKNMDKWKCKALIPIQLYLWLWCLSLRKQKWVNKPPS